MIKEKLVLRNENEICPIDINNLVAVTIDNYLCSFYIENRNVFTCTKTLKEVEQQLPDYFIKLNRSCLINVKKVQSVNIREKTVHLSSGISFNFSAQHLKALEQALGLD